MQENHCILVNSTNLLLIGQSKSEDFPTIFSKLTSILYGSSAEWSTVEADVTYINKCIKEL